MEIAESRVPLDDVRVRTALTEHGWTGAQPLLHGLVSCLPQLASGLHHAAPGSAAVAEEIADESRALPRLPAGGGLWVATTADVRGVDPQRIGWLPLVAALATADALRATARVPAEVAWPQGVTIPGARCGGDAGVATVGTVQLAVEGDVAVLTIAVIVAMATLELASGTTSLYAEGGSIDRAVILGALLPSLEIRLAQWRADDPALAHDYRDRCQTLGRLVTVDSAEGRATAIDEAGRLVVTTDGAQRTVAADDPAPVLL